MRIIFPLVFCFLHVPLSAFQAAADETPKLGAVEGRVIEAKSGEPIQKVLVILRRDSESGTGTYTDPEGKFLFRDVVPGSYTLSVERAGFVEDPEGERRVVHVKAGTKESGITVKMVRTGAVSGRILDAAGQPIPGASVQLLPTSTKKPAAFFATSNDRGEYRIYHIRPGRYRIAGSFTRALDERRLGLRMQRPSGQSGAASEEAYSTTYYPGSLDRTAAALVQVEPGADLQGFDVQLRKARAVRVRGSVTAPGGPAPAFTLVSLQPAGGVAGGHTALVQASDGKFEMVGVLPGKYLLTADGSSFGKTPGLSARRILDVGGTDVEDIHLVLAAPQKVSGRVVLPEDRKLPPGLMLFLVSRNRLDNQAGGIAELGGDGAFTIENVAAGDYDIGFGALAGAGTAGADLYVAGIRIGDTDALAEGIRVSGSALPAVEITLKPNGGTVECLVLDGNRKPKPEARVMLLPDAPRRSQIALHGNCTTDADGACTIAGVAPGAYHVFAFAGEDQPDFRDDARLKEIEDFGIAVRIAEGEKQRLEVKVIPDEN